MDLEIACEERFTEPDEWFLVGFGKNGGSERQIGSGSVFSSKRSDPGPLFFTLR